MLKSIFSSKIRVRLLTLFLTNPRSEFYIREIQKITKENFNNIRRELDNLSKAGILISTKRGPLKYFKIETRHPLYADLKNIIYKTQGLGQLIKERFKSDEGIKAAFIYGSIAKDKEKPCSDIDFMVIGEPNFDKIYEKITRIEQVLHREINVDIISNQEWQARKKKRDPYIADIINNKKIFIIGGEDDL